MTLRDLLKKKDKIGPDSPIEPTSPSQSLPDASEFTFVRTTTTQQFAIAPPGLPEDESRHGANNHGRSRSKSSATLSPSSAASDGRRSGERRLSERFHLPSRSRGSSVSSANVPDNLPAISVVAAHTAEEEAQWEKRATLLVTNTPTSNANSRRGSSTNLAESTGGGTAAGSTDENIQEAIRLHEAGNYERSTALFGKLADPDGANNPLSQVLYGLALRHGWGCEPDPTRAITFLSYAASNSAAIETLALNAGMKKGGSAKGELVLAIFELANCFRNGWGIKKDAVAAKQYYETAANLGDTDAMNEVAWCYLEGFGCKKDKFKAAQYLRLAEEKGSKTVGNTWIWKDKYGGPKK